MNWYYEEKGNKAGPIDDAELERLVAAGTIDDQTLVWRDGLSDWQPYSSLRGAPASGDLAACSQCGRLFPPSEMARFGPRWVCAGCKPGFVQRLREGAALGGQQVYGGFWIRTGARMLDGLLLFAVNAILSVPMVMYSMKAQTPNPGGTPPAGFFVVTCLTYILIFGVQAAYEIYFIGRKGATLGKMACRLKVVRTDGSPLTMGRATGRYFANLLSSFTLGVGYLIAAFDDQKRALHDHICDTRVIRS